MTEPGWGEGTFLKGPIQIREKSMNTAKAALAVAALALACSIPEPANSKVYFSFGFGHHKPYFGYYKRYPYYGSPYYYKPYPSYGYSYSPRRQKYATNRGDRCAQWSKQCEVNWGYGNSDYRGCMRYHDCR